MRIALVASVFLAGCFPTSVRADSFGSGANAFDIEFVTIGNPGNPADTTGNPNPAGSVAYSYRIGKYEISREMVSKANSDGGLNISLKDMTRLGGNSPNHPAIGISWNEAARFVNWLNTTSGNMPAYKFALQPEDAGYVVDANLLLWEPSDTGYDPNNRYRNSLAKYFLPSVDEWYKAAYFDPNSGVYYDYPTGSNSTPTPVASGTTPGTAVYGNQPSLSDITLAGGLSPYGTMGQGGNVEEWEETDVDLVNNGGSDRSSARGFRGGGRISDSTYLLAMNRFGEYPQPNGPNLGFRVASTIPEPGTALLAALVAFGVLASRGHRST